MEMISGASPKQQIEISQYKIRYAGKYYTRGDPDKDQQPAIKICNIAVGIIYGTGNTIGVRTPHLCTTRLANTD
ncbi:hypothetical protein R1A27_17520 [Methylobacterium sp. NMS12]|uniref:hypothetical protein n=1 Tax=Methylobacterium sp. NMS12 TaxID=3079766 RepID=UPI003F8857DC